MIKWKRYNKASAGTLANLLVAGIALALELPPELQGALHTILTGALVYLAPSNEVMS